MCDEWSLVTVTIDTPPSTWRQVCSEPGPTIRVIIDPVAGSPPESEEKETPWWFRVSCVLYLKICVKFLRLLVKSYFQVRLDQFGLSRLSVRDDGCGVEKDEVARMVQPHTTSKIRCIVSV